MGFYAYQTVVIVNIPNILSPHFIELCCSQNSIRLAFLDQVPEP
jgi:hypothetical protein